MATSTVGFGVILSRGAVALAKITKIGGVDISHEIIDTTSHDSPSGWKESIQGLLVAGDMAIDADFIADDAAQISLLADAQVAPGTAGVEWTMTHAASGLTWVFTANVKNLKINTELAGKVSLSFTLALTGVSTVTIGYSDRCTAFAITGTGAAIIGTYVDEDIIRYATTSGTSFTVTPTLGGGAVITVNGTVVVTGEQSGSIAIADIGQCVEVLTVTKNTGKAPTLFTLRVLKIS
jgi:predicted secreted protein